ncbi:UDP-glucuronosyltransferase 2B15 isoform X2 [Anoplophora glabripennis]|uniref:UDP-glucuronosyltransferase 2B15 isoform X2 n=1 Tax=Anoplophora glabripennis TaxID=217634 RepID=UPI0008758AB4|nr:UDP-glucuronosyltransferase 2B15 isoform X2 [Anoplophora glabripennis]
MWNAVDIFSGFMEIIAERQLSHDSLQNLMQGGKNFDVLLVEGLFPEYLAFAEIYNCPKILMMSLDAPKYMHRFFGNPAHPIVNPDYLTSFYGDLNFKERVISTIYDIYLALFPITNCLSRRQIILNKYFNTESTVNELISGADMLFVNVNPILQTVRSFGPSTVTIGSFRRDAHKKPVTGDVQDFLDSAKEGFIYFSLGSNVKSKDLRKETLEAIIDTLKSLPYKILWKFEADELPGKPDNVKLIKWSPQQSVLAHPNIILFVTQGGLQSMEEAIYSEVPLVVIPFFGDQEQNAKLMQSKGIAVIVEVRPYLDKDKLKTAMLEVITNPQYRNTVRRLKQLALDTPMTGLEKAVWWTEYVIRNKGAKHLRNPAADIPLYQYYLIDVISFLLAVVALVITAVVLLVKFVYRFISKFLGKQVPVHKKVN